MREEGLSSPRNGLQLAFFLGVYEDDAISYEENILSSTGNQ